MSRNQDIFASQTPTCSSCNENQKLVTDPEYGEIICAECGMIISDKLDEISKPEWRHNFASREEINKNKRNTTGLPTSLARYDMGLATIIAKTNRDAKGQKIDAAMSSIMDRLRMWDFRIQTHTPTGKNLKQAFDQLDMLKDKLGLTEAAVEKAAYIYRKAQQRQFMRGRSISAVLNAAVYIACREVGISRRLRDIATISNVKYKFLARTYRLLVFELDLKIPVVDPMKCIAKVANNVNVSEKTVRQAIRIMNDLIDKEISAGKHPMALAAAALYLSCIKADENITQGNISNAAGITEITIRNRLKDLKSMLFS
jgi:transcription initiation factor TFIIB